MHGTAKFRWDTYCSRGVDDGRELGAGRRAAIICSAGLVLPSMLRARDLEPIEWITAAGGQLRHQPPRSQYGAQFPQLRDLRRVRGQRVDHVQREWHGILRSVLLGRRSIHDTASDPDGPHGQVALDLRRKSLFHFPDRRVQRPCTGRSHATAHARLRLQPSVGRSAAREPRR